MGADICYSNVRSCDPFTWPDVLAAGTMSDHLTLAQELVDFVGVLTRTTRLDR